MSTYYQKSKKKEKFKRYRKYYESNKERLREQARIKYRG